MSDRRYWTFRILLLASAVLAVFAVLQVLTDPAQRDWWLELPMVLVVAVLFSLIDQSLRARRRAGRPR